MNKAILTAAIALSAASNALAYDYEWYARVGFGTTAPDAGVVEDFLADVIQEEQGIAADVSLDHPRALNLSVGYRLNPYVAFEAGYVNFGKTSDKHRYIFRYGPLDVFDIEGVDVETYKAEVSGSTKTLAAVLSTDSSQALSAGARLGYHFWNTRARASHTFEESGRVRNSEGEVSDFHFMEKSRLLSEDESGQDAFYGVFANWRIDKWIYSAEYSVYPTKDADITVSSISLSMEF